MAGTCLPRTVTRSGTGAGATVPRYTPACNVACHEANTIYGNKRTSKKQGAPSARRTARTGLGATSGNRIREDLIQQLTALHKFRSDAVSKKKLQMRVVSFVSHGTYGGKIDLVLREAVQELPDSHIELERILIREKNVAARAKNSFIEDDHEVLVPEAVRSKFCVGTVMLLDQPCRDEHDDLLFLRQ